MSAAGTLDMHRGGEGEPLVLMHGIGSTRHVWAPTLPRLEAEHEVFAFSFPGFGDSPWDGVRAGIPYLADAIEAEMDLLGIETAHVAGHSMGGWATAELARRGRCRTATLVDPAGFWTERESAWGARQLRNNRRGSRALAPVAGWAFRPAPLRALLTAGMRTRGWRVGADVVAKETRAFARCPAFEASRAWMHSTRVAGLEEISCPTRVVWGTWDLVLPFRQAKRWVEATPDAELVALPRLGHDPISDDPGAVAAAILGCAARA